TTVICPITDYFVAHHGSLGSFVRVYCHRHATPEDVIRFAHRLPGIEAVHDKATAARMFDLPIDREGDVVVISDGGTCIGTTPSPHDLSALDGHALRTHGGLAESQVHFMLNYPLRPMRDGPRTAACGTSTSSTSPSMASQLDNNTGSAIA